MSCLHLQTDTIHPSLYQPREITHYLGIGKTQNTPEVRAAIPSLRVTKARKDRHTRVSIKQQVQLKVEATHP